MQFKPGNILNEYEKDDRDGFKDSWLSSYIIVHVESTVVHCACLFDNTEDDDHKPGLSVAISKDIEKGVCNDYHGYTGVYWKEVEVENAG